MKPRHLVIAPFVVPALGSFSAHAAPEAQKYDASYQIYQEDDHRMRIESYYIRGEIDITSDTAFRFQYLHDAISGSSPMGTLPGGLQPFFADIEDVRTGVLAALSHQFGDHRVEFEASRSVEEDYISSGFALSDKWDLNQKNTTLALGLNYLTDRVTVPGTGYRDKQGLDLFAGLTQIVDKNTVVTANLTLGYGWGYLNDQYKVIQRDEVVTLPDGMGGTFNINVVSLYPENRPDERFRQVLQLQGTRYFEGTNGALDAVLRLSHDDYGVFSQSIQLEWRQALGERFEVTPFVRYYHQSAADFFANSLNNIVPPAATPATFPTGAGPNYSADYRLSSLESHSLGLRLRCQITDAFSATASYERYAMSGSGPDQAPAAAYPSANLWTVGVSAKF